MKNTSTCIKALCRCAARFRWSIVLSCIIGVLSISSSLGFVWMSKTLVDIATGQSDADLTSSIWIFAAIILATIVLSIAENWWRNYLIVNAQNQLRAETFAHVMGSRWTGRETYHSADTINRLEQDINVETDIVCTRLPDALVTIFQLLVASAYLFTMQPGLTWVLLIIMPVAIIGSRMFFMVIRRLTSRIRATESDIQSLMQESLQSRIVIKTLGYTERALEKLGWLQKDLIDTTVKRLNYNAIARTFLALGFRCGYATAFLWGIFGIRSGAVTFGMMTAFLQLVNQIQRPIADLSSHVPAFIHALTSTERLLELEDLPLEDKAKAVIFKDAPGIRVDNISFRYTDVPDSEYIYRNFSHIFEPGSTTAIMGMTGAGKSTLTKLLLGLLSPESGEITVFSGNRSEKAGVGTRPNFMYVPQGGSLLSGTIRENLLMARPDATEQDIALALDCAVAGFVYDLPKGLDTICSEKGSGLSEGQAQRIAIARALLHRGSIIILDEATSALDTETENKLLDNLEKQFRGKRTVIWITHRESVTRNSDSVLKI